MNFLDLKVFVRSLIRNKLYSIITIIGFAVSLTFVILLSIYICLLYTSIGVAHDVHYMSLRKAVGPLAIICRDSLRYDYMFLKVAGGNLPITMDKIKAVYERLSPSGMFEFEFLDQSLQQSYEGEKRLMQVISLMGGIAIVLALVGVYGLVIFLSLIHILGYIFLFSAC